jgi:hypothetical protein
MAIPSDTERALDDPPSRVTISLRPSQENQRETDCCRSVTEELIELAFRRGRLAGFGACGEIELLAEVRALHIADVFGGGTETVVVRTGAVEAAIHAAMQIGVALRARIAKANGVGRAQVGPKFTRKNSTVVRGTASLRRQRLAVRQRLDRLGKRA